MVLTPTILCLLAVEGEDENSKDSSLNGEQKENNEKKESKESNDKDTAKSDKEDLDDKEKHQLKHRELFLSRQVETLPATHIRGKCTVTLLNETEMLTSYLKKEVSFLLQYWQVCKRTLSIGLDWQCIFHFSIPTEFNCFDWGHPKSFFMLLSGSELHKIKT